MARCLTYSLIYPCSGRYDNAHFSDKATKDRAGGKEVSQILNLYVFDPEASVLSSTSGSLGTPSSICEFLEASRHCLLFLTSQGLRQEGGSQNPFSKS